jgi:hypothetical protein
MWTLFWDMSSGGRQKLDWHYIFIELPEKEALSFFALRFGRDPYNVTCDCCGQDYSVHQYPTLLQATGYHRGCRANNLGYYVNRRDTNSFRGNHYKTEEEFFASGEAVKITKEDVDQFMKEHKIDKLPEYEKYCEHDW